MIYVEAKTGEGIAHILRGQHAEVSKRLLAAECADKLLGKKKKSQGMIITAPRQSGKTTELLRYAEEKYSTSYCIVCLNFEVQRQIIRRHWELFNATNIARKLAGKVIEGTEVNPPLMITPGREDLLKGRWVDIFCDEWNGLPEKTKDFILESNMFVAAVTS